MTSRPAQIATIAGKEIHDALRTHVLSLLTGFLILAAMVSLTVSSIALHAEYLTYVQSRDLLLSLGKSINDLVPPAFFPLKLLRGFVEHVEIIGAVLGIVLGYRAAAVERGHSTLMLIMTRPLGRTAFLAGKLAGNMVLIVAGLAATFALGALALFVISGVGLGAADLLRIAIVFAAAILYVGSFFLLGFILALGFARLPTALLVAFAVWLTLVLIAPQIGDTMDPDNQVAGGVFRKLGIAKPEEKEILKSFATYETIRDDIEQASPAKHFERFSFAVLGIKDIYNGQPLADVILDRLADLWWLLGIFAGLVLYLFARPLNIARLSKEQ
ncbi:MAG: ABC transporter permease subunit [Rhizobiales bacterium]|nr:ABC transporter permease subunit [Hyphomicrobiales bacterium]